MPDPDRDADADADPDTNPRPDPGTDTGTVPDSQSSEQQQQQQNQQAMTATYPGMENLEQPMFDLNELQNFFEWKNGENAPPSGLEALGSLGWGFSFGDVR